MIANQLPINKLPIQQHQPTTQNHPSTTDQRKPQKKLSIIHQRVTQGSEATLDSQRE